MPVKGKDGKIQRWRQPPGPSNALGQIKFVMPNPKAIYLHDTNARSRFNSQVRALSHGCIRTEHIHRPRRRELLGDDGGAVDAATRSRRRWRRKKTVRRIREAAAGLHRLFQPAALLDGRSSTTRTSTAATPRRWRR